MTALGDRIKQLRNRKGMTQDALAAAAHITKASVSNYERNLRSPQYNVLNAIAEALEIPVTELLAYTGTEGNNDECIENQTYNKRPRRLKKLLAAFDSLSDDAQLTAIERIEELSLIPAYQRPLTDILQKYIYNEWNQVYEPLEDTETYETYKGGDIFTEPDWFITARHITLQRKTSQGENTHWHFLYYSCKKVIDWDDENFFSFISSISKQLVDDLDNLTGYDDNLSFIFDDELFLDAFYGPYTDGRESWKHCEFSSICLQPSVFFFLIKKGTSIISSIKEYDPNWEFQ